MAFSSDIFCMQEEDTDYAAEKLQAADELRQWSEAAQCSSIACLVGEHVLQSRCQNILRRLRTYRMISISCFLRHQDRRAVQLVLIQVQQCTQSQVHVSAQTSRSAVGRLPYAP